MEVEVARLAAYASWLALLRSSNHAVYKKTPYGFEVVRCDPGPPTPDNSFVEDSGFAISDAQRHADFWLLARSYGCGETTAFLMRVVQATWDRGLRLQHKGQPVTNVLACNICHMDLSGLEHAAKTLRYTSPSTGATVELGLYSSYRNQKKLLGLDTEAKRMFGMCLPDHQRSALQAFERERADLQIMLGRDTDLEDSVCPHWWVAFVLQDGTIVHVDLCGVAYESETSFHELEGLQGGDCLSVPRAPVTVVECPALSAVIRPEPEVMHKVQLVAMSPDGALSAYPDWRPFRFVKKSLPLMATPFDQFAERRFGEVPEALASEVVDVLLLETVRRLAAGGASVGVRLQGLGREELNGQVGRAVGTHAGRVLCKVPAAPDGIRVLPARVSIDPLPTPACQMRTLDQMRAAYRDSLREQTPRSRRERPEVKPDDPRPAERKPAGKQAAPRGSEKKKMMQYMKTDPVGKKYMMTLLAGNTGWLSQTDPEVRPALKRFAEGPYAAALGLPPSQQKAVLDVYELTQMPRFDEFREFMVRAKTGVAPQEFHERMAQPWFSQLHKRLVELGLARVRS